MMHDACDIYRTIYRTYIIISYDTAYTVHTAQVSYRMPIDELSFKMMRMTIEIGDLSFLLYYII